MNRRFTGVFLACIAAAVVCLFATMPPLRQPGGIPQEDTPYFSAGKDRIDINTCPAAELRCLPGIGEKKAQAIIAYRTQNGPFSSVEELARVNGISARTVEGLRELVVVS